MGKQIFTYYRPHDLVCVKYKKKYHKINFKVLVYKLSIKCKKKICKSDKVMFKYELSTIQSRRNIINIGTKYAN